MKVCVLADAIAPPLTGIGRYAWEIASGLEQTDLVEATKYVSFRGIESFEKLKTTVLGGCDSVSVAEQTGDLIMSPSPSRQVLQAARIRSWLIEFRVVSAAFSAKQRYEYGRALRECRGWVVHGPNYQLPSRVPTGVASVVTVHDVSVFLQPAWHPEQRVSRIKKILPAALAVADKVITDSRSCANDLMEHFGVSSDRISTVPLGIAQIFFDQIDDYPRNHTICVSTIEPRKNIETLLLAYASLPPALRDEFPLTLVGEQGWKSAVAHDAIRKGQSEGWLRYLGYVTDVQLARLYRTARLSVYPSLHEGFGLPVLEAFASGAPVIAGNHSSLPEISDGLATLLDDVTNVESLRTAIIDALQQSWNSEGENTRRNYARKFTWTATVNQTLAVYEAARNNL